jgi:hypothetical protein
MNCSTFLENVTSQESLEWSCNVFKGFPSVLPITSELLGNPNFMRCGLRERGQKITDTEKYRYRKITKNYLQI